MAFSLRSPGRTIHAGVILTKGVTELIDVAPFEFFAELGGKSLKFLNFAPEMIDDALDVQLHWVTEDGDLARMKSQAQIKPTNSFETCPPLDIVFMGAHNFSYSTNEAEKAFIRKTFDNCSAFLSICGGFFPLLDAGLLEGMTVAAPRMMVDLMKKRDPHVNWVDKRWARDGKLWSSSTLLNGMDLMRAFAIDTWGKRVGLIEALLDVGHWPERDVDFKDVKGPQFLMETI